MSGHNRWTQIKRAKEKTDAVKSKIFSKFAKLITDEAKKAGGNRNFPGLKAVVERARASNMPNENIERAVKKATEKGNVVLETVVYETYGPGGSALVIETLTDNRNKAAQEIKTILSKHGFSLASPGSAFWAFEKTAEGLRPATAISLSENDLAALEKLIDDLENCDEVQEVFTNAE